MEVNFRTRWISLILALAATRMAIAGTPDLWQSEAQLTARYGDPTDIRRGCRGDPTERVFTYRANDLHLAVRFLKGVSHSANYQFPDGRLFAPNEVVGLLEANSGGKRWLKQPSTPDERERWQLGAPPVASAFISSTNPYVLSESGEPKQVTTHSLSIDTTEFSRHREWRDLKEIGGWFRSALARWLPAAWTHWEKTFSGVAEFKEEGEARVLVLRDGGSVVTVPWSSKFVRARAAVIAGRRYHLTLREDELTDLDVPTAFVSDRLHDSHGARVVDSDFYRLVRIADESKTMFEESICEVHHVRMRLVAATVEYGMIGAESKAAAICEVEFPHHKNWIRGGCLVGDVKKAERYVCHECVAATGRYKREHPDEARVSD